MGGIDLEALLGDGNTSEEPEETSGQEPDVSGIDMGMLDAALQRPEEASGMEFQSGSIKQNKTLDDIVTPNKLDAEAEDILGSLENDVMKILKKTKYFDKVPEE